MDKSELISLRKILTDAVAKIDATVGADRNAAIAQMREAGTQYKDIASHFGISASRAREIYENHRRKQHKP